MTEFPIKRIEIEKGQLNEVIKMLKKIYIGKISVSIEEEDFKGLLLFRSCGYYKTTFKSIIPVPMEVYDIIEYQ